MEHRNGAFGKVSTVFSTKLKSFSFVPVLKKLPLESRVIPEWEKAQPTSGPNEEPGGFLKPSDETMAHTGVYKAEIVYIRDSNEQERGVSVKQGTQTQLKSSPDHLAPTPPLSSAPAPSDPSSAGFKAMPAAMATIDNKHQSVSELGCHNTSRSADVTAGFLPNSTPQREEALSPANSTDLFASLASSKESILSEGWDKERSWSGLHMLSSEGSPPPFSRTISPCSSVRSGAFSPSVVRVKRYSLAPGSSLVQTPPAWGTPCCDSLASSPCPLSPRSRHRPPPTQLSLLTAILRKGRLPILSPALQRPYTPCWPISPINMSSCMACTAASSVSSVPLDDCKETLPTITDRSHPTSRLREEPQFESKNSVSNSISMFSKGAANSDFPAAPLKSSERLDGDSNTIRGRSTSPTFISLTTTQMSPAPPDPERLSKPVRKAPQLPPLPRALLYPSFSRLHALSPKPSAVSCCSDDSHHPPPSHRPTQEVPPQKRAEDRSPPSIQNGRKLRPELERVLATSAASRLSPSPGAQTVSRLSYTSPPISPPCSSPKASSRTSTPDYQTLSPSPAISSHRLSPSPSCSLSPTPTSTPKGSTTDCTDAAGKKRKPYKIRSTYKAFAAIPTNTLLLEQQAIDDEVEKRENEQEPQDSDDQEDTHSKMCTPAQLRQQTEELFAVIDEVLEDPIQKSLPASKPSVRCLDRDAPKRFTPSPRLFGRETKYAISHLQPPGPTEKKLTKPGVIRPVSAPTRLKEEHGSKELSPNPFRRYQDIISDSSRSKPAGEAEADSRGNRCSQMGRRTAMDAERLMGSSPRPSLQAADATGGGLCPSLCGPTHRLRRRTSEQTVPR